MSKGNDEREIMLREKAGQITNGITFILLGVLTVILFLKNIETWVIIVVGIITVLQVFMFRFFQYLLSKKY